MGTMNWRLCPQDHYAFSFLTCCSSRSATSATPRRKKNDSGNRRQGGGGWGTPLKKRSATRIKSSKTTTSLATSGPSVRRIWFRPTHDKHFLFIDTCAVLSAARGCLKASSPLPAFNPLRLPFQRQRRRKLVP